MFSEEFIRGDIAVGEFGTVQYRHLVTAFKPVKNVNPLLRHNDLAREKNKIFSSFTRCT